MRVAVTGGRNYEDRETVFRTLSELHANTPDGIEYLAHGACHQGGADWLADAWGIENGLVVGKTLMRYPATIIGGRVYGRERNAFMLDNFRPDLLVAFPGGGGTSNCVIEAMTRGISVMRVDPDPKSVFTREQVRDFLTGRLGMRVGILDSSIANPMARLKKEP